MGKVMMERPRCPHCQHYEVVKEGDIFWKIGEGVYIQRFRCKSCDEDYFIYLKPVEIHYEEKTPSVILLREEPEADGL